MVAALGFERRAPVTTGLTPSVKALAAVAAARTVSLQWVQGSPETALPALLDGTGALVAEQFLTARGLEVGDSIELQAPKSKASFRIVGVVSSAGQSSPRTGTVNTSWNCWLSCQNATDSDSMRMSCWIITITCLSKRQKRT